MREKFNKLKSLLQGDSNPKWIALIEVLDAIITKLEGNKTETDMDKKVDHLNDLVNSVWKEADKIFDGFKSKIKWN